MEQYVALDVSLKEISVCVIDSKGAVTFEGKVAAEPAALISLIRSKAPQLARVGLETGAASPWLCHALEAAGLPVVLMDARHANAALSTRPTKSDRSDARVPSRVVWKWPDRRVSDAVRVARVMRRGQREARPRAARRASASRPPCAW